MKKLKMNKTTVAMLMAMSTLYGCGGGADDPNPSDAVDTRVTTSATLTGSAVKGSLDSAQISVEQMNGSPINITDGELTDASGNINLVVQSDLGFGINSPFKVTVTATDATSMMCDAIDCAGVVMGQELSGEPLTGTVLKSLSFVNVPYGSQASSSNLFLQANALTTIATPLVENAVANGANITQKVLFDLQAITASDIALRALGVSVPGVNLFETALVSAESYENFVIGEDCTTVISTDEQGNEVSQLECSDVLAAPAVITLSLANAAFANVAQDESFNARFDAVNTAITSAIEGDTTVLTPIRERLLASVSAVPFLSELGISAESVIDVGLSFALDDENSGPVQEVTTADNLAGATITGRARISDGEAETMAFDKDTQTKWLDNGGVPSADEPSWIQVEFAQAHAVSSVFITSANDAPERDPENFDLLASNDGETWVTLASFLGESFDERFERKEFSFSNGLAYSFYRLNITKNKGDTSLMQLTEIQLVGPIYVSTDHTDPVGVATITGRARISDGEAETMAFDNDGQTKWLDNGGVPSVEEPSWVRADFPEAVAVNVLAITSANDSPERDPENFTLVGSNDGGATWTTVGDWLGESFDERFERKLFSANNTLAYSSYRLNITKNKGDTSLMQLSEIELIGPEVASVQHSHGAGVTYTERARISDGEAGSMAFDSDTQTKWLDNGGAPSVEEPSWVVVALPEAAAVNTLALTSANDAPERDPENFAVWASNDSENWIELASWLGESFDARFERKQYAFSNDIGFSFYRFNITKNKGDNSLMQIAEIELIGPQVASVDISSAPGTNITGRARISDNEAETMAFDDLTSTKWLDNGGVPSVEDPSWVQLDFVAPRIVNSISITSANDSPERDPENFTVLGSNDGGATWEEVESWIGESFDNRFERKLFEMRNGFAYASYRINITKNKGDSNLMQLAEIELIGPSE
ncbi:discoidin domain-containing protein [uncultured Paraglaciecola sp.]|uniref:discoidin domain-containing protein n=1 Tax=uncultured Paraglaciecola sp. TaxID=1765024 RepID=UPI0030D71A8D|tara:strand:- start:2126 stop:4960 length:2835 start_codon:yes stop_codon:yes gene_type:complete